MNPVNFFTNSPAPVFGESCEDLWRQANLRVERISSSASPDPGLYDQEQDEWVMLVEGRAVLEVAGRRVPLSPGDHLVIPAHTPHRVLETHPEPRCLWLAVHFYPATTASARA
ncbi:MAG: cupin domain-containing protein [Chromatiaceae bacterium]|nr:cupin domain-containing protein [Chromatiaceae bacterium]